MRMPRSSKRGARSLVLFDVGASSIGAGLAVQHDDQTITLLWHTRLEYAYERTDAYEHYLKTMYATLLEAGMALISDGVRIAQRDPQFEIRHATASCVLAPPWFFAGVQTTTRTSEKRRTITHGMLDEMRATLCNSMQQLPEYVAWADVSGAGELLEQHDLARFVDGYHIVGAREYEAQEYSLRMYLAFAPQAMLRQVEEIVRRVLPNHPLHMHTSTHILALHRIAHAEDDAHREVLVEVGGQLTSVAVIEHGVLAGIATRPVGSHHFIRSCAPRAISYDEAVSLAQEAIADAGDDLGKLPDSSITVLGEWVDHVHAAIGVAASGVTPPAQASLAVRDHWYRVYAQTLESSWMQPGIRELRNIKVVPAEFTPPHTESTNLGTNVDSHLYTLACALYLRGTPA